MWDTIRSDAGRTWTAARAGTETDDDSCLRRAGAPYADTRHGGADRTGRRAEGGARGSRTPARSSVTRAQRDTFVMPTRGPRERTRIESIRRAGERSGRKSQDAMRGHGAAGCQASGGAQRHRAPGRAPSRKGPASFQDERRSGTTPGIRKPAQRYEQTGNVDANGPRGAGTGDAPCRIREELLGAPGPSRRLRPRHRRRLPQGVLGNVVEATPERAVLA